MKNKKMLIGFIAIVAITGFEFTACGSDEDECANCQKIGDTGPSGGIIIYHNHAGFTITGTGSFTAYYLEAAPSDQVTSLRWATATDSPYATIDDAANATAIGTGRNNTALILVGDSTAPAALACKNYNGGGKSDWFLPSRDELNEMYKARAHLSITTDYYWSSSQTSDIYAWDQNFDDGKQPSAKKNYDSNVRACRAF